MNAYDDDFLDYLGELDTKTGAVSKKEEERTYTLLLKKTALKRTPSAAKKCGRVLLIAAAVVTCAAVTAAASGVNLGSLFRGYFEQNAANSGSKPETAAVLTDSQVETLDKSGSMLNQSAVDNGTTITVKAAVGDKSGAYILLDVVAPEGTVLDRDDYTFNKMGIYVQSKNSKIVYSYESNGRNISAQKDTDPKDNKKSFILKFSGSWLDLTDTDIDLALSDLVIYGQPVLKGNWNLKFHLNFDTSIKHISVDKLIKYNTEPIIIDKVDLSPFSAVVDFTFQDHNLVGANFPIPDMVVTLSDHTQQTITCTSCMTDSSGKYGSSYVFNEPLDLSKVKSISFGELKIPVN
jgi:Chloramphenicol O-acetyltransferase